MRASHRTPRSASRFAALRWVMTALLTTLRKRLPVRQQLSPPAGPPAVGSARADRCVVEVRQGPCDRPALALAPWVEGRGRSLGWLSRIGCLTLLPNVDRNLAVLSSITGMTGRGFLAMKWPCSRPRRLR
jgi:hypothetical protein